MNSYNQEINFYLPGIFMHSPVYSQLVYEYTNNQYKFKDGVKIGGIYGSPSVIWNGGRNINNLFPSKDSLKQFSDFWDSCNIPIYFTFTNCLLKEKHLYDTYGNILLDVFNTGKNGIICNSSLLEKYIRDNYGSNYKYVSSTTKRLLDPEAQLKEFDENYDAVVIDYDYNKDFDFLKSIKNPEQCELLCNAVCDPHCPRRVAHYYAMSKAQLEFTGADFPCQSSGKRLSQCFSNKNFITPEQINADYIPLGFKNYKLEGRTAAPVEVIEILIYYLVKDEYALQMRESLQSMLGQY